MDRHQKDKELERLRTLLRKRNATIRNLKLQQNSIATPIEKNQIIEKEYIGDVPEEVRQHLRDIFGDIVNCADCGKNPIPNFAFCVPCGQGWAYCKSCGGFEKAKSEHKKHILPTHGVFLNMYDIHEIKNSYNKSN